MCDQTPPLWKYAILVLALAMFVLVAGMVVLVAMSCQPKPTAEFELPSITVPMPKIPDPYDHALYLIHRNESRFGAHPKSKPGMVGPKGERGPYQIRPIFEIDCARLGMPVDVYNPESCRRSIRVWLQHYAPRVSAVTGEDMYEMYHRGPEGFKKWRERNR